MHVFVTGATGFVGSAVLRQLLGAGHIVSGLARSDRSALALEAAGARVVSGTLGEGAVLADAAAAADAVIHLGYIHDFSQMALAAQTDVTAITAMGEALAGTAKPLLVAAGLAMLATGRAATEDDVPRHAAGNGRQSEQAAQAVADQGVRVGLMRLAPSVHGEGDHGFVPTLIDIARRTGVSAYIDGGENKWPAVHVDDAAAGFVRALERVSEGVTRFHLVGDEGIAFRDIASAIGTGLGLPVRSIPQEEAAAHFGWMGMFAAISMEASSTRTRALLDWQPRRPGLLEGLALGHYFDPAKRGL